LFLNFLTSSGNRKITKFDFCFWTLVRLVAVMRGFKCHLGPQLVAADRVGQVPAKAGLTVHH